MALLVFTIVLFISRKNKAVVDGLYYIDVEGNIVSRAYDYHNENPISFDKNGIAMVREQQRASHCEVDVKIDMSQSDAEKVQEFIEDGVANMVGSSVMVIE